VRPAHPRPINLVKDGTREAGEPDYLRPESHHREAQHAAGGGATLALESSMRTHHVAAALVSLACALLTASCLQSPTAPPETDRGEAQPAQPSEDLEPIGEARQETGYAYPSSAFPFVVDVKDDGQGNAGGWQKADKIFHFVEKSWGIPVYFWKCRIQIQMPIRSAVEGRITPSRAALYSAEVANAVVDPMLDSRASWKNQGAAFCLELKGAMNAKFSELYPTVGARVLLNP
jgi:hypothetical protein